MTALALALVAVFFLCALISITVLGRPKRAAFPYRSKPVLSPWERNALPVLLRQLPPGLHLCPQVRLAELLAIAVTDPKTRAHALRRVACKSVDFVIVDLASGAPVLVIELDDRSHQRQDRIDRDAFVNKALQEAGIPVARFRPKDRLDIRPYLSAFTQVVFARAGRGPAA